jgi:hypothetical protein
MRRFLLRCFDAGAACVVCLVRFCFLNPACVAACRRVVADVAWPFRSCFTDMKFLNTLYFSWAAHRIRTEIDALHAVKGTANGALQLRYVIENDRFIYIVTNYIR